MANRITVHGRLVKDVDLKDLKNDTKLAIFTIACDGRMKDDETSFFDAKAFNKKAEIIAKNFSKGSPILVFGSMRQNSYTKDDGTKVTRWELLVDDFDFVGSKQSKDNASNEPENEPEEDITVAEGDLPF